MKNAIGLKKPKSYNNSYNFIVGFFQIARLHTGMQAVAYMLLSIYLVNHQINFPVSKLVVGGLIVILIVSFGFIVDDIRDFAIDKFEKPNNAIPSGRISYQSAIIMAILFATCSIIGASFLGTYSFVIILVNILLCISYSYLLRDIVIIRSLTIAYLTGSIITFGCVIAKGITFLHIFVFSLIFLFTCAQEILYAVIDYDVDRMNNFPTSATALGIKKSLKLFGFFLLLVIIVTLYLGIVTYKSSSFEILMIPCIILPLFLALTIIIKSSSIKSLNYVKIIVYFTRFLSFLALWSL
jgi:geranylgeranylglycerol-phosphate geranylgeranyltransferase